MIMVWFMVVCASVHVVCGVAISSGEKKVTTASDSGVCFYGKTADRVLTILATGKYRSLLPTEHRPKDCSALHVGRDKSGIYKISPDSSEGFEVYCDMETDGGGWTVLVRRKDGSVDFNQNWKEYEDGFGNLDNEFWLGNCLI